VLSVVLVAFSGGLTNHARQVLKAAAAVQVGTLILGVVSLAGIVGATAVSQTASSYISQAAGLAIAATALIFTVAVIRSQARCARWHQGNPAVTGR
jgi:membrane protein YdbS with pleckstrin-like domain